MPPEGFDGKRSIQTDIWSVGVNLYQLLTGALPFPQKEPSNLIAAIIMREPELLPADIPLGLKNVIAKALAKQPEDRYSVEARCAKICAESCAAKRFPILFNPIHAKLSPPNKFRRRKKVCRFSLKILKTRTKLSFAPRRILDKMQIVKFLMFGCM